MVIIIIYFLGHFDLKSLNYSVRWNKLLGVDKKIFVIGIKLATKLKQ